MPIVLDRDLLDEVAVSALQKQRVIFLVKDQDQADRVAATFRTILCEVAARDDTAFQMKPPGSNPSFIQLKAGGWVSFFGVPDLSPQDNVGQANLVWWPTEGGLYACLNYATWKRERKLSTFRPVAPEDVVQKVRQGGPPTAWEVLMDAEDAYE